MTFTDWLKAPFLFFFAWLFQGIEILWGAYQGYKARKAAAATAAAPASSGVSWFKLLTVAVLAAVLGGCLSQAHFTLPSLPSWPWHWPWPIPTPFPDPAPIPDKGLHVLVVLETADLSKLPSAQATALHAQNVRQYLNTACPVGPDGKTHTWRILDKDQDLSADDKVWQDAMKRPRQSLPWIIVSNPGKGGFEGPLPGNADDLLALLKKYGD